eukprot:3692290-Alexandrium_andersonii.AAC.1
MDQKGFDQLQSMGVASVFLPRALTRPILRRALMVALSPATRDPKDSRMRAFEASAHIKNESSS